MREWQWVCWGRRQGEIDDELEKHKWKSSLERHHRGKSESEQCEKDMGMEGKKEEESVNKLPME